MPYVVYCICGKGNTHTAHRGYAMNNLQIVNGAAAIVESQSIGREMFDRFIAYLDAKPKTVQTYTRALKQFAYWLADNGISRPQYEDIKAFRDSLLSDHKPATVQLYTFAVRRFFEWTESAGLYPNVAGKIKGAKISREPKKDYLTSEQAKAVLANIDRETIQGKRDYAIVTLMLTAGLRDIEVSRATVEDLRTAGNNTVLYVWGKGKDEKADYVIIPAQTERAIRTYLQARGTVAAAEPLFTPVSNNGHGQAMTTRSISQVCKQAMRAAGYDSDRLTAHSLRHTAVTLALISGSTLQEAQQFARHASIATTTIYAHNLEKQNNKCSRLVADSIF